MRKNNGHRKRWSLSEFSIPLLLGVAPLVACSSQSGTSKDEGVGVESETGGDTGEAPVDETDPATVCDPGVATLRRLTREEYENTVTDLLGVQVDARSEFQNDDFAGPFPANFQAPISSTLVNRLRDVAEEVAQTVDVGALLPCAPDAVTQPCIEEFIRSLGARAYRRPLTDDDVARLWDVYDAGATTGPLVGVETVVSAMLQSPNFLYHVENSNYDGTREVGDFEMASRLSYFLWKSMPDDELFEAAANGELATKEQRRNQVIRMLQHEKMWRSLNTFAEYWLGIQSLESTSRDPELYPGYVDGFLQAAKTETLDFFRYVILADDARLETLLSADYSFPTSPLEQVYGMPELANSDGTQPITMPAERRGVLGHASFLTQQSNATETSPVRRGIYILHNILCQELVIPEGVDISMVPEPQPGMTTRERYALHTSNEGCAACHSMIDPLGFALEKFDPIGAYREYEGDLPIDDSATLELGVPDLDGPLVGGAELAQRLAKSETAKRCMAEHVFRWGTGREPSQQDHCTVEMLQERFVSQDGDMVDLIISFAASDWFRLAEGVAQ